MAKLDEKTIKKIHAMLAREGDQKVSAKTIAKAFGVSMSSVYALKNDKVKRVRGGMKNPETLFKEKIQRDLKKIPNLYQVKNDQRAVRGIPDMFVCVNGFFVAMELKTSKAAATKKGYRGTELQRYNIQRINEAGGRGYMVWPEVWPDVLKEIQELARGIVV